MSLNSMVARGTIPGVPTFGTAPDAPDAPCGVVRIRSPLGPITISGSASTSSCWLIDASGLPAPTRRNSAVTVASPTAQAYTAKLSFRAATPVTVTCCDAVPHPPIPTRALSLDTTTS